MGNPIRRDLSETDPLFFIPEGVDELAYSEESVLDEPSYDDSDFELSEESDIIYEDNTEDTNEDFSQDPPTPDILGLVSETLRTAADGSQVVDVLLDVEELPGGYEYEFKVAKI